MAKYEARHSEIEATQWFKNGDHPKDNSEELTGTDGPFLSGGKVVRRYRHPNIDGQTKCDKCSDIMHNHGWIDKLEEGETVCPGDWIITGFNGLYYSMKPNDFNSTYNKVSTHRAVRLNATKKDGMISISEGSFEHLLNCLDNQKFAREINADALTCDYESVQKNIQEAIDDFNRQCRELLHFGKDDDTDIELG